MTDDTHTSLADAEALPWGTLWEGIEMKVLRAGGDGERYTLMNRFAPGTELPRHHHLGEVHAWTIQGRWGYLEYDWTAEAGSYVHERAGGTHTLKVPDDATEDAVVLFVMDKGLELLDDDGSVFHTEDAASIVQMYKDSLAGAGIELDESLILP